MESDPLRSLSMSDPSYVAGSSRNTSMADRQVVSAVQSVNKSEMLGTDRELVYRRDPKTGQAVVQVVERGTGDVVDQIPLEVLLRLQLEYEQENAVKAAQAQDPYLA